MRSGVCLHCHRGSQIKQGKSTRMVWWEAKTSLSLFEMPSVSLFSVTRNKMLYICMFLAFYIFLLFFSSPSLQKYAGPILVFPLSFSILYTWVLVGGFLVFPCFGFYAFPLGEWDINLWHLFHESNNVAVSYHAVTQLWVSCCGCLSIGVYAARYTPLVLVFSTVAENVSTMHYSWNMDSGRIIFNKTGGTANCCRACCWTRFLSCCRVRWLNSVH